MVQQEEHHMQQQQQHMQQHMQQLEENQQQLLQQQQQHMQQQLQHMLQALLGQQKQQEDRVIAVLSNLHMQANGGRNGGAEDGSGSETQTVVTQSSQEATEQQDAKGRSDGQGGNGAGQGF
jgi:hypothetical protein